MSVLGYTRVGLSMVPWLKVLPWAVLVAGVFGWCSQRDGRLRAEGYAEAQDSIHRLQMDSLRAKVVADSIQIARTDSAAQARIEWAEAQRTEAERLAQEARARRPAIVERIVHAPDTAAIRAAVEELEAEHETEVLSLREAIAQADSVIAQKDEQIEARDRALVQVRSALRAAIEVREANTSAGLLEGLGGKLIAAGVGAGIGYLAGGG